MQQCRDTFAFPEMCTLSSPVPVPHSSIMPPSCLQCLSSRLAATASLVTLGCTRCKERYYYTIYVCIVVVVLPWQDVTGWGGVGLGA